jgi:uncharacterized protein YbjT (DUF2867 family)
MKMTTLVLGGTGTVGSAVVQELLKRGEPVRVPTRSEEKVKTLPEKVQRVVGDLIEPRTYGEIFSGVEKLFLLNAVSLSETQEGLVALNEAKKAGVRRIVYLSIHNVESGPHIPHFANKIAIEHVLKQSHIPYTILRPNNFFQNDYWFRDALLEYLVYPQPIGDIGISRVDVRDIAEAGAIALTEDGHEGKTYALVGPMPINGHTAAELWSTGLDKKINYAGNDLDAWEKEALKMLPAWMVYDFRVMYALFQEKGLVATDEEVKVLEQVLGRPLRSFASFVAETAESWR